MLCIFSSSLHPFMPLVASCSGQRQFPWPGDSDDSDLEEDRMMTSSDIREDNRLMLWWAGPLSSPIEQGQEEGSTAWELIICNSFVSLWTWIRCTKCHDAEMIMKGNVHVMYMYMSYNVLYQWQSYKQWNKDYWFFKSLISFTDVVARE